MEEIEASRSSFVFCISQNVRFGELVLIVSLLLINSLVPGELPAYASPGSSPMHSNFSIYFSICNLLQQLLVSFQMSYSEDIND